MTQYFSLPVLLCATLLGAMLVPASADAKRTSRNVRIFSTPAGAKVYLDAPDGQLLGTTPIRKVRVEFGQRTFYFVKDGYSTLKHVEDVQRKTRKITVTLKENATINLTAATADAAGAVVKVNGKQVGYLPYTMQLDPGRHFLEVEKEGFDHFEQWIDLKGRDNLTLPVKLIKTKPKTGTALITADVSGATVTIDGTPKGQTPLVLELPPGPILIKLTHPDYPEWSQMTEITEGQKTIVEGKLKPDKLPTGIVFVTANKSDAIVFIDGVEKGQAPVSLDLPPGPVLIQVRATGVPAFEEKVMVVQGQKHIVSAKLVAEKKPTGTLLITSDVTGATISVDGEVKGSAPMSVDLPAGPALIEVRSAGFPSWSRTVTVVEGRKEILEAKIKPEKGPTGTLLVISNQDKTLVFIDGKEMGPAPINSGPIAAGTHIVEARAEGFDTIQEPVEVEADKQALLKLDMKPRAADYGTLSIRSSVPEAMVFVDGGEQGMAPVEMKSVPPGPHGVVVRLPGYRDFEATCDVKPNAVCSVMADLVPLAKVEITANIKSARLFIDDREMGPLPWTGDVAVGVHDFRVDAPDHDPVTQRVILEQNATVRKLEFTLLSLADRRKAADAKKRMALAKKRLGASSMTGMPPGPGQQAFELGLGIPYLAGLRMHMGILDHLAGGVEFRVLERDNRLGLLEAGLRVHTGIRPITPISFGAFGELSGGSNFQEETKRTSSFSVKGGGMMSLHFGDDVIISMMGTFQYYKDWWKGDESIGRNGSPDGDQSGWRARGGLNIFYWGWVKTGFFVTATYGLGGDLRKMYRGNLFGLLDQEPSLHVRAGITRKF